MAGTEHLTAKQRRYAEYIASGMESQTAARSAGYSNSFARVAYYRMQRKPAIAAAIESIRAAGRTAAAYTLVVAMREAQEVIDFAKLNKNAMAYFKAVEHRAKLSGLLIDKVEVVTVDLKGALTEARGRVITTVDITPRHGFVAASAVLTGVAEPLHKDAVFGE